MEAEGNVMSSLVPFKNQKGKKFLPWAWSRQEGQIHLFSAEGAPVSKCHNDKDHQASSVQWEVHICSEMVYGTLHQSEEGSTACSRHRQVSGQAWIQLVHLKREERGLLLIYQPLKSCQTQQSTENLTLQVILIVWTTNPHNSRVIVSSGFLSFIIQLQDYHFQVIL